MKKYLQYLVWLPVPVFVILIILLRSFNSHEVFDPPYLRTLLNFIFLTLTSIFVMHLVGQSFLVSGRVGLLFLGCGTIFWGCSGLISSILGTDDVNIIISVHNICVFLAAVCHFTGVIFSLRIKRKIHNTSLTVFAAYGLSFCFIIVIAFFALKGKIPLFFVQDRGGTLVRYVVLNVSVVLYMLTAIFLMIVKNRVKFNFWYSVALTLIAVGIVGISIETSLGNLQSWLGRSAQYLGGVYIFIASLTAARETRSLKISIGATIQEIEERYQKILDNMHEGCAIISFNWTYLYVNKEYAKRTNIDHTDMIGKCMFEVIPKIETPFYLNLKRCLELRMPLTFEYKLKLPHGISSWLEVHCEPVAEGIFLLIKNIDDRKKAEEALRKSEEKLKIAMESGNIATWEWNIKTDEVICDERMAKMVNIEPETFGKTFKAFEELVNEEDISHFQKAIELSLSSDVPFETLFRTKLSNGKVKYISSKGFVVRDVMDKPQSITGVCYDVTWLKESSDQIVLKLNEELLRSNKELQSFAYIASHDLQEPLRMVSSFTQLLSARYGDKLDKNAKEYIQFAVDGAKRMQILINDLLAYSRIQTKGKEFSKVDMHDIVEKAQVNLKIQIQEKNICIKANKLPVIVADESQMLQLMQNLIGNAVKFSNKDSSVEISAKSENDIYIFSVRDEGLGIESQYFEKIFQIFQRLAPQNSYDGTGIGLAICKRIVERHGGRIWLESEPGIGSTFYFSIPG